MRGRGTLWATLANAMQHNSMVHCNAMFYNPMHCKTLECGGGTLYERHSQHNSIVHWKTLENTGLYEGTLTNALLSMHCNIIHCKTLECGEGHLRMQCPITRCTVLNTLDYIRMQWRNISKLRALIKVGENGTAWIQCWGNFEFLNFHHWGCWGWRQGSPAALSDTDMVVSGKDIADAKTGRGFPPLCPLSSSLHSLCNVCTF